MSSVGEMRAALQAQGKLSSTTTMLMSKYGIDFASMKLSAPASDVLAAIKRAKQAKQTASKALPPTKGPTTSAVTKQQLRDNETKANRRRAMAGPPQLQWLGALARNLVSEFPKSVSKVTSEIIKPGGPIMNKALRGIVGVGAPGVGGVGGVGLPAMSLPPEVNQSVSPTQSMSPLGKSYEKQVLNPRMSMDPASRFATSVFVEPAQMMLTIARGLVGVASPEEGAAIGKGLGQLPEQVAGFVETGINDPKRALLAQPEIITSMLNPAARAGGALLRSKVMGKTGRGARAARYVADVADPSPRPEGISSNPEPAKTWTPEAEDGITALHNEKETLPGMDINEADRLMTGGEVAMQKPPLPSLDSKGSQMGRGVRRAVMGAQLLGEVAGGSPLAFAVTGAGAVLAPKMALAMAQKLIGVHKRTAAKQTFVDASAASDAAGEAVVRSVTEAPLHTRLAIESSGQEIGNRVSTGRAGVRKYEDMRKAKPDAPELQKPDTDVAKTNLEARGDSVTYPEEKTSNRIAIDKARSKVVAKRKEHEIRAGAIDKELTALSESVSKQEKGLSRQGVAKRLVNSHKSLERAKRKLVAVAKKHEKVADAADAAEKAVMQDKNSLHSFRLDKARREIKSMINDASPRKVATAKLYIDSEVKLKTNLRHLATAREKLKKALNDPGTPEARIKVLKNAIARLEKKDADIHKSSLNAYMSDARDLIDKRKEITKLIDIGGGRRKSMPESSKKLMSDYHKERRKAQKSKASMDHLVSKVEQADSRLKAQPRYGKHAELAKRHADAIETVDAAKKENRRLPQTELGTRFDSGQIQSKGESLTHTITDKPTRTLIGWVSEKIKSANKEHAFGDPKYLADVVASADSPTPHVLAFSARARGALSEKIATAMMDSGGDWSGFVDSKPKLKTKIAKLLRLKESKIAKMTDAELKQSIRAKIETMISDEVSKPTAGGTPSSMDFKVGDNVFSSSKEFKALLDSVSDADAAAIKREAVIGLFDTIKTQYVKAETFTAVGRAAAASIADGANRVSQIDNALVTVAGRETLPLIVAFDPSEALRNMGSAKFEARLREYGGGKATASDAKAKFKSMIGDYVKADGEVDKAVRAGLSNLNKPIPDDVPVFIREDVNNALKQHLSHINAIDQADSIMAKLSDHSRITFLAGSMKSIASNVAANIIMIASAYASPSVLLDIRKAVAQKKAFEAGSLTGVDAVKMRSLLRTGITNSSRLSESLGRLKKNNSTSGLAGKYDAIMEIQKQIYGMGDGAPKLAVSSKMYDSIMDDLRLLKDGEKASYSLPNDRRVVFFKENGKIKTSFTDKGALLDMTSQELSDAIARVSITFASNTLFDFNDLPGAIKGVVTRKGALFSVLNIYAAWQLKAMPLPGKPGLLSHALGYDPTGKVMSNSKLIMQKRAKLFTELAVRRFAFQQTALAVNKSGDESGLNQLSGWVGQSSAVVINKYFKSMTTFESIDLSTANYAIMADSAIRMIQSGFAAHLNNWFGAGRDPAAWLKSKKESERNAAKLYLMNKSGQIANKETLWQYAGLTGSMLDPIMEAITNSKENKIQAGIRQALRLLVGNNVSTALQVGADVAAPYGGLPAFSNRKFTDQGRREAFIGWFIAEMFRFGGREKELYGPRGIYARNKNLVKEMKTKLVKPLLRKAGRAHRAYVYAMNNGDMEAAEKAKAASNQYKKDARTAAREFAKIERSKLVSVSKRLKARAAERAEVDKKPAEK